MKFNDPDSIINLRPKMKVFDGQSINHIDEKLDGYRITVSIPSILKSKIIAVARKPHNLWEKISQFPSLELLFYRMPPGTVIDGELIAEGHEATKISHFLAQGEGPLKFCAFAMPYFGGADLRRLHITEIRRRLQRMHFTVPRYRPITDDLTVGRLLEDCRTLNIEGMVLKDEHYSGWYKLKPYKTVDAFVLKYEDGENDFTGIMGALRVGVYDEEGNIVEIASVGSGYDIDLRSKLTRENTIGKVIEVKFDSVTSHQRLRFPVFLRFRDDKPMNECHISQIK